MAHVVVQGNLETSELDAGRVIEVCGSRYKLQYLVTYSSDEVLLEGVT